MFFIKKKKGTINKEKIVESILNWSYGHEKYLNVVSLPYSCPSIFIKTILEYVLNNRKVLYITNEKEETIKLIELVKANTSYRDYSYIRNPKISNDKRLKVAGVQIAEKMNECFDLIIYDDLNSLPVLNREEIINLLKSKAFENTKCISFSIESAFEDFREVYYPSNEFNIPIIEPRTVLTRIDINKDIPFVIYDYLKWSIDSGRKVIIYLPDKEKLENVYQYIRIYCDGFAGSIGKFSNMDDYRVLSNFQKIKDSILITYELGENELNYKNTDIMIFFANYKCFNYKKLVHLCRRAGRGERDLKGEVIFLANEENDEMEEAKNIARNFNKEAWEMGLLRL